MNIKNPLVFATLFAASISFTGSAQAAVNCNQVETIGNAFSNSIKQTMNNQVAGSHYKINRRKSLDIHGINNVSFKGCTIQSSMKVTLNRKVRRNAHGNVNLRANVSSFDGRKVCLSNVKVTDVSLSRTLGIGENIYKMAANKAIKNNQCFVIR